MGHLPGAKKSDFLFRGAKADEPQGSRAGLILLIPAGEVSPGSPRVGTIHVQAPTPHAPPLPAYFGQFSQPSNPLVHELLGNGFQKPSVGPSAGVCGTGDYPLPDLPREASRRRSATTKSKQFGPDGAPFP